MHVCVYEKGKNRVCGFKGTRKSVREHIIKDHKIKCRKKESEGSKKRYYSEISNYMERLE